MKKAQLKTVQRFYSGARPIEEIFKKAIDSATGKLGIKSDKIVCADSFCSDELNSISFLRNERFSPFKLGGLGGYPFGSLTGMGAFAAHIPAEGAAIIFFGPHIGITNDGTAGKINRMGQEITTGCCGSVTAAVQKLLGDKIHENDIDDEDFQQKKIEQILLKEKVRIQNAEQNILEAVDVVYEAIETRIDELISKTAFHCKNIIEAGGIFINSDKNENAFWSSRRFNIKEP